MADVNDNPFLDWYNPFLDKNIRRRKHTQKAAEINDVLHADTGRNDDFVFGAKDVSYTRMNRNAYEIEIKKRKKTRTVRIVAIFAFILALTAGTMYYVTSIVHESNVYNRQSTSSMTMKEVNRGNNCRIKGESCGSDTNGNRN